MKKEEDPTAHDLSHLSKTIRPIATQSNEERIKHLMREQFIPYTRAELILNQLEGLYRREGANRAQGRLFIGPSLSGKSSILHQFVKNHRADDNVDGDAAIVPVLMVQYPETGREGIYSAVCHALNHKPPVSASMARLRSDCIDLLKAVDVQVLLIDEFHNVLRGNTEEQRIGLTTIKYVMNAIGRPVVVAGTSEAYNAIHKDDQMMSRLRPIYLERFRSGEEDFLSLLAGFELRMPLLKASNLMDPDLAQEIYRLTEGLVGHVADLLSELGVLAIQTGEECITTELVKSCSWAPMADKDLVARTK